MRKTLLVAKCGICIETMMPNESAQCMMSDRFAVPSPISREYAGIGSVLLSKMFKSLLLMFARQACDKPPRNCSWKPRHCRKTEVQRE
jgi:hypothetical protein